MVWREGTKASRGATAMTRDEIVQIAWDVGILMRSHQSQDEPTKLERFAERIAAAEREACAKVAEITYDKQIVWYPKGHYIDPNSLGDINKAVAEGCAAAIRARGE
jgi:hypothetical protein